MIISRSFEIANKYQSRKQRSAEIRLDNMRAGFEAGADPAKYTKGSNPIWEKYQAALEAVLGFDFTQITQSLEQLENVWFPTNKMNEKQLVEFKELISEQ